MIPKIYMFLGIRVLKRQIVTYSYEFCSAILSLSIHISYYTGKAR